MTWLDTHLTEFLAGAAFTLSLALALTHEGRSWLASELHALRDWWDGRGRRHLTTRQVVVQMGTASSRRPPQWTADSRRHVTRESARASLRRLHQVRTWPTGKDVA